MSPLIAIVLIIAFALSVASLMKNWFFDISKQQTEAIDDSSNDVINCTSAMLSIEGVSCSSSDGQLKITITNIGSINLYDFSVFAIIGDKNYVNATGGPTSGSPLSPGEQTILVYGCDSSYCSPSSVVRKVVVTSSVCPSAWIEKDLSVTCA